MFGIGRKKSLAVTPGQEAEELGFKMEGRFFKGIADQSRMTPEILAHYESFTKTKNNAAEIGR